MTTRTYTKLWLVWGAIFAVIEGAALYDHGSAGTLSETTWRWIGASSETAHGIFTWPARLTALGVTAALITKSYLARTPLRDALAARRLGLGIFLAWLTGHFFSGGAI